MCYARGSARSRASLPVRNVSSCCTLRFAVVLLTRARARARPQNSGSKGSDNSKQSGSSYKENTGSKGSGNSKQSGLSYEESEAAESEADGSDSGNSGSSSGKGSSDRGSSDRGSSDRGSDLTNNDKFSASSTAPYSSDRGARLRSVPAKGRSPEHDVEDVSMEMLRSDSCLGACSSASALLSMPMT